VRYDIDEWEEADRKDLFTHFRTLGQVLFSLSVFSLSLSFHNNAPVSVFVEEKSWGRVRLERE
jgi:hypothetical protein